MQHQTIFFRKKLPAFLHLKRALFENIKDYFYVQPG